MQDAADYAAMSRCTKAEPVRKKLITLSAEERKHAKKLQTAAYMLFGGNMPIPEVRPKRCGRILGELRRRFEEEQRGADAYNAAAGSTGKACLKKLYAELAEEETRHAEELYALLERML